MGLKIIQEKTRVVNLQTSDEALDFLGFRFQCQGRFKIDPPSGRDITVVDRLIELGC